MSERITISLKDSELLEIENPQLCGKWSTVARLVLPTLYLQHYYQIGKFVYY
jgi:hypothetical protein